MERFGEVVSNEPELTKNPALEWLRNRVLKEPIAFFRTLRDELQADRGTRPESLARLADASYNLGVLTAAIGDQQDALIAYQESLAIRRKLADANPAAAPFQSDLATTYNNIGLLPLHAKGKPAEALESHCSALAIRRKLVDANPADTQSSSNLAGIHYNIGLLLDATGKPAEALGVVRFGQGDPDSTRERTPGIARFRL